MPTRAALFDMDGTLIAGSTAALYTRYRRKQGEIGWASTARVGFWSLQYSLGVIEADRVARLALQEFAGQDERTLWGITERWFQSDILARVRETGRQAVEDHRRAGDLLAIVTASTEYAARPLARVLGIDHVVASQLEVDDEGRLTGRIVQPLCYGVGKVVRAERLLASFGIRLEDAVFYTDSITDLPLLERVGVPVAVCPDRRLSRVATRRRWSVERW